MLAGENQYSPGENLPEGSEEEKGRARDKAGKVTGVSGKSVDAAKKLIEELHLGWGGCGAFPSSSASPLRLKSDTPPVAIYP